MKNIDARGLSCPEPVVLAKEAADAGEKQIEVLVDTEVCKENVSRFLRDAGYTVTVKEVADEATITAKK
ncbi:sulfurtransferase TusA family protein [uncultured Ezakiella sp.]|uniref:sulfurtransferase TusA family protein n=1 Tax=uncultured Ezakiella sp. TaxID=1637529 RepID=UPI0025DA3434|nr:sulfurtransferase TusA family protein [uncultured Ezakiella sp.]